MTLQSPSAIGARSEMAVASALQRSGMEVFVPIFAAHARVDLVVQAAAGLLRVQCKTARLLRGSLYFRTHSNTGNIAVDYRAQVDAFGVFSPDLELVYLVPIEHTAPRGCNLRVETPMNGQRHGVRWAADYLIGPP